MSKAKTLKEIQGTLAGRDYTVIVADNVEVVYVWRRWYYVEFSTNWCYRRGPVIDLTLIKWENNQ